MSTPAPTGRIDLLLQILETTNIVGPISIQAVANVINIIRQGRKAGKTDEEIAAEAADSIATAQRTKSKAQQQISDEP